MGVGVYTLDVRIVVLGKNVRDEWLAYSLQISYGSTFIYIDGLCFESRS